MATCPACGVEIDPASASMTSLGVACERCARIEADGGRLVSTAQRAIVRGRPRGPAKPPSAAMRATIFVVFFLVTTPCLYTGVRDLGITLDRGAPAEVRCAELGSAPGGWVVVTGCRADFEVVVVGTMLVALPERAFIPVRPVEAPPGAGFSVILETHDADLVRRAMSSPGGFAPDPMALEGESATGMLVDLDDIDVDARRDLEALPGRVSGTRVLRAGEEPPGWLWIGLRLALGALVILFGAAIALDRPAPRKGTGSATPPQVSP